MRFLESSTISMPIAGTLFWTVGAVLTRVLSPAQLAPVIGFGSGAVFPLGMLIDRVRGRKLVRDDDNPVQKLFLQCLVSVALIWPLVILTASVNPGLVVLGASILMGIVWIFYGWAADDPVGLRHAVARGIGAYAVYIFLPNEWKLTGVCIVTIACYGYSMVAMKKPAQAWQNI